MPLESLLLCRDPDCLRVMRRVLDDVGIQVEVCTGPEAAREVLDARRFDAVLVDCDDMHDACSVLQHVRNGAANRNCIAFAITNGITSVTQAFHLGANFVMEKPLTMDRVTRMLRTARGLIESERRRYFRVPVEMVVIIRPTSGGEYTATATNISSGGMALKVSQPLPDNQPLNLFFTLPGQSKSIEIRAELAWAAPGQRAGVRFRHIPQRHNALLMGWIDERVEQEDPSITQPPSASRK
jgi:CheY-like chemotaxis protein